MFLRRYLKSQHTHASPLLRPVTRRTLLLLGGLVAIVAIVGVVMARRGPARLTVDSAAATRKPQFRSTVTASGEIVATRYADIGSSVMGKIVSLPVAEGDPVKAGQILARIDPGEHQPLSR